MLNSFTGILSKFRRIYRLACVGKVTADLHDMPRALNGASCPAIAVSGEIGAYSKMTCANPAMPIKFASLVAFWAEVE